MGFCIKVFVYSSKEYVVVTISANNLVVWQKIRPNKAKKSPKNCRKTGIWTTLRGIYSNSPSILPEF